MYYTVIIAFPVVFITKSFTSTLPWMDCNNEWNTPYCLEVRTNRNFYGAFFFYLILILNLLLGNALKKLNYLSRYRYLESKSVQNTSRRIFSVSLMETVKFQCKLQTIQNNSIFSVVKYWKLPTTLETLEASFGLYSMQTFSHG